jgi:glycosyltransferase involved in cell wall biosynthesis
MLPFFFRHYDPFVDHYVLFDDGSTDRTLSLLADRQNVEVRQFVRSDAESFAFSEQSLSNHCWKESRGVVDWVIVTDIDEHLFHPSMLQYLGSCSDEGITLIPALGFQMISEGLPATGETLCQSRFFGTPWTQMMKPSIFKPSEIDEINFSIGRHTANPIGNVRVPHKDELLLLHYKYLNFEQTYNRHRQLATELKSKDIRLGMGHKYGWSRDELRKDWDRVAASAVDVRKIITSAAEYYPYERWWSRYR